MIDVFLEDLIQFKQRSLECCKAEHKTEAHIEEQSLKVNILDPNFGSLRVIANASDGSFKQSLHQLVSALA
jgi:hypothetical protein